MKPDHIGYLVRDMQSSIEQMELLGYHKLTNVVYDGFRDIDICFVENNGYKVELIKPKSENSVVAKLLKKIGVSPYHICYNVEDIELTVEKMRKQGYIPTGPKQIAPAINNYNAIFLYNPDIGIVELIEVK